MQWGLHVCYVDEATMLPVPERHLQQLIMSNGLWRVVVKRFRKVFSVQGSWLIFSETLVYLPAIGRGVHLIIHVQERFEDTKGVIRSRRSKDIQYNS